MVSYKQSEEGRARLGSQLLKRECIYMGDQVIILLVGVGMLAVGLYLMFGKISNQKPGLVTVEATIMDQVTRMGTLDSDHPNHGSTASVYPVYEYTVNGRTYHAEGTVNITVFSKEKYRAGNRETVWIHPDKPEKIHTTGERNGFRVFGGALIIMGLAMLYIILSDVIFYWRFY